MSNNVVAASIAYHWKWIHTKQPLIWRRPYWSDAEYKQRLYQAQVAKRIQGVFNNAK